MTSASDILNERLHGHVKFSCKNVTETLETVWRGHTLAMRVDEIALGKLFKIPICKRISNQ